MRLARSHTARLAGGAPASPPSPRRPDLSQQPVQAPPRPPQASLPLLQRELLHCARLAKQTPAQYLAQHEQLLLDASASSPSDSSELLPEVNENGKRRTPDRYLGGRWRGRLSPCLALESCAGAEA